MRIYTRKGDGGTTGLLYGGDRISKAAARTDAYGTTDEAVSALGIARAAIGEITDRTEARLAELILRLQRELFVVGAEIATHLERTTVRRAERRCVALADAGELPDSQVVPYLNRLADLLFVMARVADGGYRPVRTRS